MPLHNPTQIVLDAKKLVESGRRSEIRLKANGGNSILIRCEPMMELEYINKLIELLPAENFSIIDLNQCLMDYVSNTGPELEELYNLLQSSTQEIFKAPAGEDSNDLYKEILHQIDKALKDKKVPVLIKTGALYGTGIHNIHIMESGTVMNADLPLLILYPATIEQDQILFLGKQPSSKYRCYIIP